ncbi:MAG: glycosyltransferase family 4 protein [Anaerolineae bacterium]
MRIGLNAQLLSLTETYRGAGINWYIRNLLLNLPQAGPRHHYIAFLNEKGISSHHPALTLRRSRLPTAKPLVRILWEQLWQPWAALREGTDLLHCLAFVRPLFSLCPVVITIYDLSFLLFPASFKPANRLYLTYLTRYSVKRAARLIAISASTKNDLAKLLQVPEQKVDVVHCGVDKTFRPIEDQRQLAAFRSKRGLPEKVILFVGTIEPRKNVIGLIAAYSHLKEDFPHVLVIGGAKGWFYEEVFEVVERLGLRERVIFPGYIPQSELPLWYNAAQLFVYPSLYEGFGLPVLEAMACGTPVITSSTSSLPEVVGQAGLTVDPLNSEEIGQAMRQMLGDNELWDQMRQRGLERAREFSWLRTAQETVRVYERALGDGGEPHV